MPNYTKRNVTEILDSRDGLIKIKLDDGSRAYNIIQNSGDVEVGDDVIVNTTAIDLALGTGGWHFVLWNLKKSDLSIKSKGHIMKLRYSALQLESGVAEEFDNYPKENSLKGAYVIAAPLHSQIAPIVTLLKNKKPNLRIAVAISDSAALPLAISDLMHTLKEKNLVDTTITFGHAYGGDIEAINIFTALLSARNVAKADVIIVSMGPGIVGTSTEFGFTGIDVGYHLDTAKSLGAKTIGILRSSSADPRERHQGISHHSMTTFSKATHLSHILGLIDNDENYSKIMDDQIKNSTIASSHEIIKVHKVGILKMMEDIDLNVTSMGRKANEDELFFEAAAAGAQIVLNDLENV